MQYIQCYKDNQCFDINALSCFEMTVLPSISCNTYKITETMHYCMLIAVNCNSFPAIDSCHHSDVKALNSNGLHGFNSIHLICRAYT